MQSRNPVLRHATEQAKADPGAGSGTLAAEGQAAYNAAGQAATSTMTAEQLQELYDKSGPGAGAVRGGEVAMTLNDVIVKTALSFVVLLAGAVFGWMTADTMPWLMFVALFVGLGLGLANAFKKQVSPPLVLLYALVEGVFLGAISQWYYTWAATATEYSGNIVVQAVLGTLVAFGVMLFLYSSRIIKVNGTFMKIMMVSLVSYLVIALASLVAAMFGVGEGFGFYGAGPLGIILCLVGVGLAAFSLAIDFETIMQAVRFGVPERESWRMAFGLMATLIWLYLEILRLLAIIANNSR